MCNAISRLINFLKLIKFSHTIFAMPFALGVYVVSLEGRFDFELTLKVVIALILARTSAMLFNRIVDWEIDKKNLRTQERHKFIPKNIAIIIMIIVSLLFMYISALINHICFLLSPIALIIIFVYSFTKRFTNLAQFFLGFALSIAPIGAWLAVRGEEIGDYGLSVVSLDEIIPVLLLSLGIIFWVAGFDTIYASLDEEFDRKNNLHSIIIKFGRARAFKIARILHFLALLLFFYFGKIVLNQKIYFSVLIFTIPFFIYEHFYAQKGDVKSINKAFFLSNAVISFLFLLACILGTVCN